VIASRYVDEENADAAHDEDVQDAMDDSALADAYLEGQRAGMQGIAAGLNPWADIYSAEYSAWERGRLAGDLARLARRAA
jgi:hypothetical protein